MRGYIYRLFDDSKSYIGSTTQSMSDRIRYHDKSCKSYYKNKDYTKFVTCYEFIKDLQYEWEILAEVDVEMISHLRELEQFYIDTFDCVNTRRAFQSKEDKKIRHRKYKESAKQYWEINKEKIKQRTKAFYEKPEKNEQRKEYLKKWRKENPGYVRPNKKKDSTVDNGECS